MTSYEERYRDCAAYFGDGPNAFLIDHLDRVRAGGRILDIGVGQGRNAMPLARLGYQVTGIDSAPEAIVATRALVDAEALAMTLWQGSFVDFEAEVGFDAILVFGVLQELPRDLWATLFARLRAWLAPGGLLFMTAWQVDDPRYATYAASGEALGLHSFTVPGVGVRSYLEHSEIVTLLSELTIVHHWEGLGDPHHHGDGVLERHGSVEVVALRD